MVKRKRGENTYLAFIVGPPASLAKLLTNNGCPGRRSPSLIYPLLSPASLPMADPAYCEPPPPPKLPGPKLPEPEAAAAAASALHEADKLPMDSDLWKGPMEENEFAREFERDELYEPEEGIFWG